MRNSINRIILFLTISTLFGFSLSQIGIETISVVPGVGIYINGDSVLIRKTKPDQLLKLLNLQDNFFVGGRHWDGVEIGSGKSIYGFEWVKHIKYKGLDFEFVGPTKDSLSLKWIRIKENDSLIAQLDNSIILGQIDPTIDKDYYKREKFDYISKNYLTYNLYSYGVSFQLDSSNGTRILREISVHYILSEGKK